MTDHSHYEYAEARHDHHGEYAGERHDHDHEYAARFHRHYDDESTAQGLREDLGRAEERIRELEDVLRDALNRIHQLEDRQPDCAGPEADDEAWRSTLADYQVASGVADDPDCGCGLGAARCRDLEDGGPS